MSGHTRTKSFSYYALAFSQRDSKKAPRFLLFHAPAADIIKWADVDKLEEDNPTGAQRPLRGLKVRKVARFFANDPRNTIPTAVVVALDEKCVHFSGQNDSGGQGKHGKITISPKGDTKPALIIDGQHRAFGASEFAGKTQLCVVAFLGGDDDAERAFQFVVINNSATRVSKNHIRALNLSFDKELLNQRLIESAGVALGLADIKYEDFQLVDGEGPFKGLLAWPTNPHGFIPPNAIEGALAEARDRAALLGIEDLEREFFQAIWTRIKKRLPGAWRRNTTASPSHLLQKVSIHALTLYMLDSLEAAQRMADTPLDFTNEDELNRFVDRVILRIPEEFWTMEWQSKELDTSAGRQLLLESLKTIDSNVRFNKPWYEKVHLVDPAELKDDFTASRPQKRGSHRRAKKRKKK